ncbi:MAG: carboxypeptidase regulatory-like domain-containing protein [Acidobacteriaceae bacterium]
MRKLLVLTLVTFFSALTMWAAATSGVSGKVADPSGALIPNAVVTLTSTSTNASVHAETDADGAFTINNLAAGNYTLVVTKAGFTPFRQQTLHLHHGQMFATSITMALSSVQQSVVVNAGTLDGATPQPSQEQVFESNQSVRVLDRMQMDAVGPVAGAAQIVSMTPGANVTGYGNTGATKYTITLNGINQGWGGYGGFTGGGSLGVTFDGVPIVDPGTGLWQSPTIPQTDMIQNTNVTYGPGDPADRWYTNIGGAVEFTPVQPRSGRHGDVNVIYGRYNQKNISFDLTTGIHRGWSTVFAGGAGQGDDFRNSPDGFKNPSKDLAIFSKTVKNFQRGSLEFGGYYAHSGGYRAQVIPIADNPGITMDGQPGSQLYSQKSSGFYSTIPYNSYNKYDTNEMALLYGRENVQLDDTTSLQNLSWYMHIARSHYRLNDVYSPGAQLNEWNSPYTDTIGDKFLLTKRLPLNTINVGAYFVHALYNSRNNFYNPAYGGAKRVVNIGGKIRSGYFDQDNFAILAQDDIHPLSILHITPGIRLVGFQTGYSNKSLQDFTFAQGVTLSSRCPLLGTTTPGNTKDQGATCDAQENRTGVEPSVSATVRAMPWLEVYGGYLEALRSPQMGGGGGLFQSVDPASYHLQRGSYYQAGFKIHTEGTGFRNGLLFGAAYYHQKYANQEIDTTNEAGDTISANGTSAYHGMNIFFDDDPIGHLHIFANANVEGAKYTSYVVGGEVVNNVNTCTAPDGSQISGCQSYNGSPVSYVPNSTVNAGAFYDFKPTSTLDIQPTASFQFIGSQHIFNNVNGAPSTQTMPGYGTMNLGVKVPFHMVDFKLNALNVLNKKYNEYEYISSGGYFGTPTGGYTLAYPAAPATVYGGVSVHF